MRKVGFLFVAAMLFVLARVPAASARFSDDANETKAESEGIQNDVAAAVTTASLLSRSAAQKTQANASASPNPAFNFSFGHFSFFANLANDVSKGSKSCPDLSQTGGATFNSSVLGLIKKMTLSPGDTVSIAGFFKAPPGNASGPVTGMVGISIFSYSPGLANFGILNGGNTGMTALGCGGNATGGSGPGTCGNGFNCFNGSLVSPDPNGMTNCASAGNSVDATTGIMSSIVFYSPFAGALCNTAGETWADCCHDPKLVIIDATKEFPSKTTTTNGPSSLGIATMQGVSGTSTTWAR